MEGKFQVFNANNTGDSTVRHAKVTLPEANVPAHHPFKHKGNHALLLKYLQDRLLQGKQARDERLGRLIRIDRDVAGWMKMAADDREREAEKNKTGSPQATMMNLPLAWVHLDDMMTYFAQTFAPNRGMFYHSATKDEKDDATQIVTKMNNDAIYSGYYREVLRGIFALLKYNQGGFHTNWESEQGPKLDRVNGKDQISLQTRWSGNKLKAVDMYNFLYDSSVEFGSIHKDAEFAGVAEVKSFFWLQKKAAEGLFFNCKGLLGPSFEQSANCQYYRYPPTQAQFTAPGNDGQDTNWVSILSESSAERTNGIELVTLYIHLNPVEFGLVPMAEKQTRNRYEVWRFTVANDSHIISADYQDNIHGFLPYCCGLLNDDSMESAQKSTAEILRPLQDFASFLMNVHITGTRSNIYGTTFYDPTMVDYGAIPAGEVNARVPIKSQAYGKDLRSFIFKDQANLDTSRTMQDLESVMAIIDKFFPTQSLPSAIASIDRAVDSQVAAVQQGSNRRQQKSARLIDDCVFRNVRFIMYYNVLQYQADEEELTDLYTGQTVKLNLGALKNSNLPFIIGQGLKTLDRMALAGYLQNIIFALIQAPQAAQGIDLLAMIDDWTTMLDMDLDMKKYRLQVQANPDGTQSLTTPDGEQVPGETAATGITPATAPAALTSPIYGG